MTRLLLLLSIAAISAIGQQSKFVPIPSADGSSVLFSIQATEVTVQEFQLFVDRTGYQSKAEADGSARTRKNPGYDVLPEQPVTYVTPLDASAYCAWIGGRLPTDQEWEYAASAGANTRHFWGDEIDPEYLWYRPNSEDRPQPVGTKLPNKFGLYDVEGNVWEWTLPDAPVTEETLANRRGSSWVSCENIAATPGREPSTPFGLKKYYRVPVKFHHRYDDIGFRCLKPNQNATPNANGN